MNGVTGDLGPTIHRFLIEAHSDTNNLKVWPSSPVPLHPLLRCSLLHPKLKVIDFQNPTVSAGKRVGCLTTQIALERVVSEECTMYSICSLRSQEAPYTSHLAQTTYASRHIPPQTIRLSLWPHQWSPSSPIWWFLSKLQIRLSNYHQGKLRLFLKTFSLVPLHILWLMIAQCVPQHPQSGRWCLWISASLHSVVSLHDLTE